MTIRRALIAIGLLTLAASAHAQVVPQPGPPFNIACAYNDTPVTLTNGQAGWIQCANDGSIKINGSISVSFPTIGAAVPSTGIYSAINVGGTLRGVTGLGVGSTFSPTVAVVDASGNQITSFGGTNASVSATGAAVPASATYLGINTGGNLVGWTGALAAGSAIVGKVGIDQTTPGTTNLVALTAETTKVIGTVNQGTSPWADNISQINGVTPLMGNGATGTGSQRVTIASDNTAFSVNAQPTPVTTGGLSLYFVQPTASDNHAVIKAGAGQVYHISVTNNSATVNYLRLYNATTGFNGCNSATNLVGQWAIPASTSVGGLSMNVGMGIAFATGISICVTSGYATTDTTNATASAMSVNVGYK